MLFFKCTCGHETEILGGNRIEARKRKKFSCHSCGKVAEHKIIVYEVKEIE